MWVFLSFLHFSFLYLSTFCFSCSLPCPALCSWSVALQAGWFWESLSEDWKNAKVNSVYSEVWLLNRVKLVPGGFLRPLLLRRPMFGRRHEKTNHINFFRNKKQNQPISRCAASFAASAPFYTTNKKINYRVMSCWSPVMFSSTPLYSLTHRVCRFWVCRLTLLSITEILYRVCCFSICYLPSLSFSESVILPVCF